MKTNLVILLLFTASLLNAQNPILYSSKWGWTRITNLSDEFNSTTFNTTKWYDWDPYGSRDVGRKGITYANPNNLILEKGSDGLSYVLKIIAKKEFITASDGWGGPLIDYFYQSGIMKSIVFFKYGYFEIKARIPNSNNTDGIAFWFWHAENNKYSELDVFETQPIFPFRYPMALHWSSDLAGKGCYEYNQQTCTQITTNITQDFHIYGVDWHPDKIDWYIDGKLVQSFISIIKTDENGNVIGSVPVSNLGKMGMMLQNHGRYGVEPSKSGDEFEIDYFRYFKRKPNIILNNYDNTTGFWTYEGTTGITEDLLTWSYNTTQISNVTTWNNGNKAFIKFKKVGSTATLTLKAAQTLTFADERTPLTVYSQNSLSVGYDNPEFYYTQPYFKNNCLNISAYAVSSTPNSEWSIGIKNPDETIDWSKPQRQWGLTAYFTNLLSGKTYVISHGVYNNNVPWKGITKEIYAQFDSDFFINEPKWENNQLNLYTNQVSTNPSSEWHIALIKSDGSLDYSIDQQQWGNQAIYRNLTPGKKYQVIHGNYGVNQSWVETRKNIFVNYNSNFEFYSDPNTQSCTFLDQEFFFEGGNLKLRAYARALNYASVWYLYILDDTGNYKETDPPIQGPIYSTNVTFSNLQYGESYMIKHGVYDQNSYWTETRKTIKAPASLKFETADTEYFANIKSTPGILNNNNEVQIYPNPTDNIVTVLINDDFNGNYKLINMQGQILEIGEINGITSFELNEYPNGLYIIIITDSKYNFTKKIELSR